MPEKIVIGLDIDERSVKLVKLKINGIEASLLRYSVLDIPPSDDKISAIAGVLKELFRNERSDTEVYVNASGANVSMKRMTIPVMPDEEIKNALLWEAKNLVPFTIENAAMDFYKIGKVTEAVADKYDIMFAAAGKDVMDFLSAVSKEAGVKFTGVTLIPLALRALLSKSGRFEKNKINAVIDIGADSASINILKGDTLNFTREITVAGDSITKAMTGLLVSDRWQMNLTYEQAEDIKIKYGIPVKDSAEVTDTGVPLAHVYEMMAPTLRRLQNEILRSFDYYKEEFREEKIDNIFLTGGSSGLLHMDEYFSNALGIKVENLNPVENLRVDPSSRIDAGALKKVSIRLALAVGLALEQSEKINLLKVKVREKSSQFQGFGSVDNILKKLNINIPAGTHVSAASFNFVLALIVVIAIVYNVYLANMRDRYKNELASKQAIMTDVNALNEKRAILQQITKEQTHLRETLSQITRVLPAGVTFTHLSYDNSKHQIIIAGEAGDARTVGIFLKSLQDSPDFQNVVLSHVRKAKENKIEKAVFQISFNLT